MQQRAVQLFQAIWPRACVQHFRVDQAHLRHLLQVALQAGKADLVTDVTEHLLLNCALYLNATCNTVETRKLLVCAWQWLDLPARTAMARMVARFQLDRVLLHPHHTSLISNNAFVIFVMHACLHCKTRGTYVAT